MDIVAGIGIYYVINQPLKRENNVKMRNNYLSSIHVIVCLLTGFESYFSGKSYNYIIRGNTCGFFVNEIIFFMYGNFSSSDITLIIHHLIMFGLFYTMSENSPIISLLIMGEMSNLPGNLIYHRLQLKKEYAKSHKPYNPLFEKELQYFQCILYSFLRIVVAPFLIYQEFTSEESIPMFFKAMVILIYIMGVVWSTKLYKKCKMMYDA
jgi:hypothetical protein